MSVSMPVHMTMTVSAASVIAATMSLAVVVMVAMYRRIVGEFSGYKIINRRIRFALHSAVYGNFSLG